MLHAKSHPIKQACLRTVKSGDLRAACSTISANVSPSVLGVVAGSQSAHLHVSHTVIVVVIRLSFCFGGFLGEESGKAQLVSQFLNVKSLFTNFLIKCDRDKWAIEGVEKCNMHD